MSLGLTRNSSVDDVARAIILETKRRGYMRIESVACVSTGLQESGLRMVYHPNKLWGGYYQQDNSYPGRDDPNLNILGFLDRLDAKRTSPGHGDIWKNIFWLQQRPSEKTAEAAFRNGRQAYLSEIQRHTAKAEAFYDRFGGGTPAPAPTPALEAYGMPRGSNSGGYGNNGVKFPAWVYALGDAFGLKPSTYPGHQEGNRNEAGYAPNPQNLNRGIDWAAPGAADEIERMTRFADYLATIPQHLEQVIWRNPRTKRSIEVAGGRHQPGYFAADLAGHENHVHTRQSRAIPLPGGTQPAPVPPNTGTARPTRPQFEQIDMFGKGGSPRSRQPTNFFFHTEEGNGTAKSLAEYCQGQNGVSYHFTLRDRKVYYVVPTNLYSWSVLAANVFSVNLCFAGSRAAMSRAEWLQREGDIEIAAFIAVREARHFGFSTEVLTPQAGRTGRDVYAGEARPGISDHNYVTRELGIGNHTDVGPNFPWDVFTRYVTKYSNPAAPPPGGDDELSAEDSRMIREMYEEWNARKKGPSRSFLATDGSTVESPLGFLYNIDGNVWTQQLTWAYLFHVPLAIEVVESVAKNGSYQGSWVAANDFNAWLNQFGQAYCQGLVEFKAALVSKLSKSAQAPAVITGGVVQDASAIASAIAALLPAQDNSQLAAAYADNARLREEIARLQTQVSQPVVYRDEPATNEKTSGDIAGSVVDSVKDWTARLLTMDAEERGALTTSLKALQPPTGSQS